MQKMRAELMLLLVVSVLLTGCGASGIGTKSILRGVYLEKQGALYCARLICFRSAPAADTSKTEETALVISGDGPTVFEALQTARQSQGNELFYGQNELLLIGPELAASGLFDALDFLVRQQTGRPSTGVYLVDLTLSELQQSEELGGLIDAIELVRKQGGYQCELYQLANGSNGLIPYLHLDAQAQSAVPKGAALYQKGKIIAYWDEQMTQLGRLFAGQGNRARFYRQQERILSFLVDSAHLVYEVSPSPAGPELRISLRGHIRQLQTERGAQPSGVNDTAIINQWINGLGEAIISQTFENGNDIFGLTCRMKFYQAEEIENLKRHNRLYTMPRVVFQSVLTAW